MEYWLKVLLLVLGFSLIVAGSVLVGLWQAGLLSHTATDPVIPVAGVPQPATPTSSKCLECDDTSIKIIRDVTTPWSADGMACFDFNGDLLVALITDKVQQYQWDPTVGTLAAVTGTNPLHPGSGMKVQPRCLAAIERNLVAYIAAPTEGFVSYDNVNPNTKVVIEHIGGAQQDIGARNAVAELVGFIDNHLMVCWNDLQNNVTLEIYAQNADKSFSATPNANPLHLGDGTFVPKAWHRVNTLMVIGFPDQRCVRMYSYIDQAWKSIDNQVWLDGPGVLFGFQVALSYDTLHLAVSDPTRDSLNHAYDGRVYVYSRPDTKTAFSVTTPTWMYTGEYSADMNRNLGTSLFWSGNMLYVGQSGDHPLVLNVIEQTSQPWTAVSQCPYLGGGVYIVPCASNKPQMALWASATDQVFAQCESAAKR